MMSKTINNYVRETVNQSKCRVFLTGLYLGHLGQRIILKIVIWLPSEIVK